MNTDPEDVPVGDCPVCGVVVGSGQVLIEYEKGDERTAFSECPSCHEVVRPQ